jgi:hypothetical protein
MTASDVLDGAFAILKRAPATVVGLTAVFVVPIQAISAYLNRGLDGIDLSAAVEQTDTSFDLGGSVGDTASGLVLQAGSMVALVFVAAGLARLVAAWHMGTDLSLGELLRGLVPRAWALVASFVLVHLLEGASIVGVVLPLAVMTWFLVTAPVIGVERLGPIKAMRRSARLVSRRFWNVLGLALLCWLVEQLFGVAISLLPVVASGLLGTDGIAWILPAVAGIVTQAVTIPFVAGATVLVYLDLRVRTEGLDLELRAGEAFPVAA